MSLEIVGSARLVGARPASDQGDQKRENNSHLFHLSPLLFGAHRGYSVSERASLANKPQLSGLQVKVKVIRTAVYESTFFVCSGSILGNMMEPEDAGGGDEFAFHFRVGRPPRKRPTGQIRNENDFLLIVEQDIRAGLAK